VKQTSGTSLGGQGTTHIETLSFEQLTDHVAAWFRETLPDAEHRRLLPPTLQELAKGLPVAMETLSARTGIPVEEARSFLRRAGGEWDSTGTRLIGWGLTHNPTPHRFEVSGHDLYTWCAADSVFFPVVVGVPARIVSPCASTGELIHIDMTPSGVQHVEPAGAVVSIVTPTIDISEVRRAVCKAQNFYRSEQAAAPWREQHPEGLLLQVKDVFELYRRAAQSVWDDQLPS
jgi:alkylmercury lyase